MWLNDFKVALVQKDIDKLDTLLNELPSFSTLEEMTEASYLMKEAMALLQSEKMAAQRTLQQIKKNIDFLKSTHSDDTSTLNIKL